MGWGKPALTRSLQWTKLHFPSSQTLPAEVLSQVPRRNHKRTQIPFSCELKSHFPVSQIGASSATTLAMLEVLLARNPIQDFRTPSDLSSVKSTRFLQKLSFQWTHFQMESFRFKKKKKSLPALFTVVMQPFLRDLQILMKKQTPKIKH